MKYRAAIHHFDETNLRDKIRESLEFVDWKNKIFPDSNVWVKPNLTFPEYMPGVTTSPHFMAALLDVLKERTKHLTVFEADGGNNSYTMERAFEAHNLYEICESRGVRLVNLTREETKVVKVPGGWRSYRLPLNKEMLEQTDMTISVPVPKMHFVTRYTGAIKNHWGTVPDSMRLRNHFFFKYAINEIIRSLKSQITVVDGEYFLDNNGPVTGEPVKMDIVMAADNPLTADMLLMDIMGVDPNKIGYVRESWKQNMGPKTLADIELNTNLEDFKTFEFTYQRDPVDYLAWLGFHSYLVTWIVYLSPLNIFAHWWIRLLRGGSRQVENYYDSFIKEDDLG
ncbi:DUF362 domain-containing protein [bacterium]|nr:DUF362 domain-containing protein [bacterium]MBU1873986.1 DUF362 domain-containing protein [bacterium]